MRYTRRDGGLRQGCPVPVGQGLNGSLALINHQLLTLHISATLSIKTAADLHDVSMQQLPIIFDNKDGTGQSGHLLDA